MRGWSVAVACILLPLSAASGAEASPPTLELLQRLLRIDTSNPPGDTTAAAAEFKRVFDAAGIENETIVAPNGKAAHFIARLRGNGKLRPVLVAAHTDVVPVDKTRWSVDPFGASVKEGYVYGRGTLDNKGAGAAFAHAVLRLKRERVALARDVIFLAEADEEQGEFNTGWLAQHHWPKIDAEFTLNEGGSTSLDAQGRVRLLTVSTADKVTLNLTLTAQGTAGHSSRPLPPLQTANGQLIDALARLIGYETPVEIGPQSREYLQTLARLNPGPFADAVGQLLGATDPTVRKRFAHDVVERDVSGGWGIEGVMRNTLVVTMLDAGIKPNVIPGSATATLNARLLPGTDVDAFIASIRTVIANERIAVDILHRLPRAEALDFLRARSRVAPSPTNTQLFDAIRKAATKTWPGVSVVPTLLVASTDATPWRERGVPVYGIGPFPADSDTAARIHGDDERVAVKSVEQGAEFVYRILRDVAASEP